MYKNANRKLAPTEIVYTSSCYKPWIGQQNVHQNVSAAHFRQSKLARP